MSTPGTVTKPYEIEPELLGPLPRRVREQPHMISRQLWLSRITAILVCFFCFLASQNLRGEHEWLRHQQQTVGTVVDKSIDSSGKTTKHNMEFTYGDSQKWGGGTQNVDLYFYDALRVGGPITIYYSDIDRSDWRLSPVSLGTIAELQVNWYFGITLGALAALGGLWGLKAHRRQRILLLQNGKAAVATVTKRRLQTGSKGETYRYVTYEWSNPPGAPHSKEIAVNQKNYDRWPEATPFTVICTPDNFFDSVPYSLITEAVVTE